jgi:hypothetical protein
MNALRLGSAGVLGMMRMITIPCEWCLGALGRTMTFKLPVCEGAPLLCSCPSDLSLSRVSRALVLSGQMIGA